MIPVCEKCNSPSVFKIVPRPGGAIFETLSPTVMVTGFSAVLCMKCSNAWDKLVISSMAIKDTIFYKVEEARTRCDVFRHILGDEDILEDATAKYMLLLQVIRGLELEAIGYAERWMEEA